MKIISALTFTIAVAVLSLPLQAQDLAGQLQKGLFEEEANRDLNAAIEHYQEVVTAAEEQRKITATALHRLAECYRKQGNEEKAREFYLKLHAQYPEQAGLLVAPAASTLPSSFSEMVGKDQMANLETDLRRAQAQHREISQLLQNLETKSRADLRQVLPTVSPDAHLDRLLAELNSLQQKYAGMEASYSKSHPEIQKLKASIKAVEEEIESRIDGILGGLKTLAEVKKALADELRKVTLESRVREGQSRQAEQRNEEGLFEPLAALLDNSPDLLNAPVTNGVTFLQHAASTGNSHLLQWLIRRGADLEVSHAIAGTALHIAVEKGYKHIAEALLQAGADVNSKAAPKGTPLHVAAGKGFSALAELLLSKGAAVNASDRGWTPLHRAAKAGYAEMVKLLLEHGADIDAQAVGDVTPLYAAARAGQIRAASVLLEAGANPNLADGLRNTPLHYAAMEFKPELVKTLLDHGAAVNPVNDSGRTPLNYTGSGSDGGRAQRLLLEAGGVALTPYTIQFGDSIEALLSKINEHRNARELPPFTVQDLQQFNPKLDLASPIPAVPTQQGETALNLEPELEDADRPGRTPLSPGQTLYWPAE